MSIKTESDDILCINGDGRRNEYNAKLSSKISYKVTIRSVALRFISYFNSINRFIDFFVYVSVN